MEYDPERRNSRWACDCPGLLPRGIFQAIARGGGTQRLCVSLPREDRGQSFWRLQRRGSHTRTEFWRSPEGSPWVFDWVLICTCVWRNYLILEKENQKGVSRKITGNDTGLEIVHVPKPVKSRKTCHTQGIEKRPQKSVSLGPIIAVGLDNQHSPLE